jgi:beta-lactamase regulating signal transducer with metallopeptidase domain
VTALCATLLHFVWQAALAALLLAGANRLLRGAAARYAAACATLAAMLTVFAATYGWLARQTAEAGPRPGQVSALSAPRPAAFAGTRSARIAVRFPKLPAPAERAVVLCWLVGVALLSARLLGGWAAAIRLPRRGTSLPSEVWRARLDRTAARLRVTRPVRLLASALVEAPTALGLLRPVILLPLSVFTALTAAEIEAILAHELAHIRRHDFLVNLLQSAAETLLFYHPAVWWVSHRIRVERENACDDLAVAATGDAALYARALVGLEESRGAASPRLAVAATGGSLLRRVARILAPKPTRADRLPPSIAAVLAIIAVGVIGAAARVTPLALEAGAGPWTDVSDAAVKEDAAAETPTPPPAEPAPAAKPRARAARPAATAAAPTAKETGTERAAAEPRLTTAQLIAFRIHGVTPEFVEEVRAQGYARLSADDLVSMRIHGVTPEYIRAINRKFGEKLSVDDLIGARIHGVKGDGQ